MQEVNLRYILKESKKYLIFDILVWFLAHNIPIAMTYLLKLYFDSEYKNNLLLILLAYSSLFFLRMGFIKVGANIDIRAQHKWSSILYEKIIDSSKKSKYSKIIADNTIDIIQNDVSTIVATISYGIDTFCNVIATIIAFVIMATINFYIALIILIVPIIIFIISKIIKEKLYQKNERVRKNQTKIINGYQYIIKESRKIRIESLEDDLYNSYSGLLKLNMKDKISYGKFMAYITTIQEFIVDLNIIIILLGFSFFGSFSPGDIALFISYSFIINDLSTYITNFSIIHSQLNVSIDSFNKKIVEDSDTNANRENEEIYIENIAHVLDNIELGVINILIGKNGSGKTTILKKIAEDRKYPLVLKNSSIIDEDLKTNIVLDSNSSKYDRIVKKFFLERLYKREILSKNKLSGGELDRISLARVMISGNSLILVDNNLLSIDKVVRDSILKELEQDDCTVLLVDQEDREEYSNYNKIFI